INTADSEASDNNNFRWVSVFSSFDVVYLPLKINESRKESHSLESLISNECRFGTYLPSLKSKLISFVKGKTDDHETREEMILKIQNLSYPYYKSLWCALSINEQFLLYDLAEDGLTNY